MKDPYNILVVDDNEAVCQVLSEALGEEGYSVTVVVQGEDALLKLRQQPYPIVLLDLMLPGMHGSRLLQEIKRSFPKTDVIIMTSHASLDTAIQALRLGAQDYLIKPFDDLDGVIRVIKKTLEKHRLLEENERLFQELKAKTQELGSAVERLSSLNQIGHAMHSILDLRELLNFFVHQVSNQLQAERVSLMLLNKKAGELSINASVGLDERLIREVRVRVGEGIAGWVVKEGKPLLVVDIEKDPRFQRQTGRGYDTASFISAPLVLSVPIKSKDEVLGLINVNNKKNGGIFSETDLEFVATLAHQAAIAIENARLFDHLRLRTAELKEANFDSIKALAEALETKDVYTRGHSDRTVVHAEKIAQKLGLSETEIEKVKYAAILHDIGKIGIPEQILNKPAKLSKEEFELMKTHPVKGAEIIKHVKFLIPVVPLVRHDHERWDGKGYPDGLRGEGIPLGSRIVAIVDAYDAMTTDRVYRKAPGKEYVTTELIKNAGTQFDPNLVKLFLPIVDDIEEQEKIEDQKG